MLNDHRKKAEHQFLLDPEPDFTRLFGDDDGVPKQTRRFELNEAAFLKVESFRGIIKVSMTARASV